MKEDNDRIIASWAPFLDLPVTLSVELGRARMNVRDILQLGPSSIIKLDRSTGEGVDIRADDIRLLRGEIVVVEDRAGVRVNEVLSSE